MALTREEVIETVSESKTSRAGREGGPAQEGSAAPRWEPPGEHVNTPTPSGPFINSC